MFQFAPPRRSRRPSLPPMIDVVFLLLVFFMLASQFGRDAALPLTIGAPGLAYDGPPRLVQIGTDSVSLNGAPLAEDALAAALVPLTASRDDIVVLRADDTASLQRLIDIAELLRAAGFAQIAIVE